VLIGRIRVLQDLSSVGRGGFMLKNLRTAADRMRTKKTDLAEHLLEFHNVGLLFNEPTGFSRLALHVVIRNLPLSEPRSARSLTQAITCIILLEKTKATDNCLF
jgi:hypothetical protein